MIFFQYYAMSREFKVARKRERKTSPSLLHAYLNTLCLFRLNREKVSYWFDTENLSWTRKIPLKLSITIISFKTFVKLSPISKKNFHIISSIGILQDDRISFICRFYTLFIPSKTERANRLGIFFSLCSHLSFSGHGASNPYQSDQKHDDVSAILYSQTL